MKKIINNKVYDTKTAHILGKNKNEKLFRKKTGEFFLYEEGEEKNKYSKIKYTNNRTKGEKIIPLTYEEAQKWAEEHLANKEYLQIFGNIDVDCRIIRKEFSLRADSIKKLKRAASKKGVTMVSLVEELIDSLETN